MKKLIIILVGVMFLSLFITSCRSLKEPEGKKEVQVQRKEVKQQPSETRIEDQPKPQKQPLEIKESPLTEEEQKFVEKIGTGAWVTPNVFKSEEEARRYLKILLKGKYRTIRWFHQYFQQYKVSEDEIKSLYGDSMATALSAINPEKKESFDVIVEVLKTKREYPQALARAARVVKFAHDTSVIPLLRAVVKHPSLNVRLEAAGALLVLGDADTALPVLDELTKAGNTYVIPYLFKSGWSREWKLWDERGLEIIKRALNYPQDQVKAEAALFLAELGIDKEKAEEVAIAVIKKFKDKTEKAFGLNNEEIVRIPRTEQERYAIEKARNAILACEYAMDALEVLKSKKAIPLLMHVKEKNIEWFYSCKSKKAEEALEAIRRNGGKK